MHSSNVTCKSSPATAGRKQKGSQRLVHWKLLSIGRGAGTGRTGDPSMTGEKSQWLVSRGKVVAEHRPMGAPF